jgi:PAS domain S-box-containing protein
MPDDAAAQDRRVSEVERLQRLLDEAPSFMVVVGRDMRFYLANRAYREMIGQGEIVGRAFDDVFPTHIFPTWPGRIAGIMETGKPFSGKGVEVHLPAGVGGPARDLVLDFTVQPIVENGTVIAALLAGNDVTAQHRAEAQLRESEERFRLIADSAPVPIWVTKLDRTRAFVNQAYLEFVGVGREEAMRFDWRSILHPDDHDRILSESLAGEASLKAFVLEARYRRGDGEWRWLRSTSQPRWGPAGEHAGFIGVAHDVTESKEAEQALRELNETLERRVEARTADLEAALARLREEVAEREKAEDALRHAQKMEAVGQLTGGIAHDFNNLLTPIIGGLELIAARVEEPRLQRLAAAALESGRRGAKLATQLLAFSRLQRISMAPVDVNHVVAGLQGILRHTLGATAAIDIRLDPGAGHALCDANQLENALLNLAINARDAMPEGGTLTIATLVVEDSGDAELPAGDYVCLDVADTGHGMPPEVLARATEPFFSTKPIGKGTGLGLAQVYAIARQSGGALRIDSREGEGTRVRLLLPRVAAGEAAPDDAGAAPPLPQSAKARILVIDDDAEVREFLMEALGEIGHEVETCSGGAEGLERLDTFSPDLVLLDYAMPGMNGADVARAIVARRPGQRIVFITGYAESERIDALGGDLPVLRKPFSMDALVALIPDQGRGPTS